MKGNTGNKDSVQNRFTAYLMAAVKNKRISYMEKKKKIRELEGYTDVLERGHTDFEREYEQYRREQSFRSGLESDLQMLIKSMEEQTLVKALLGLKKREQEILMDRVFGEQSFGEIGQARGLTAKQAEMAYYYILRKLRKKLEGKRYESI